MATDNIDFTFYDRIKDIYDLKGRMGRTDYIDFLTHDEVPKNVMKGIDCYNRKFITLKIGGYDIDTKRFFRTGQVFFERYTGSPYLADAQFDGSFIWTGGGTTPIQYELINDLVDRKIIKLKEEHRFNSNKFNCIVATMDYWENCAAKIIQKNWNICRYNPNYTVCKNILNKQYDEYFNELKK